MKPGQHIQDNQSNRDPLGIHKDVQEKQTEKEMPNGSVDETCGLSEQPQGENSFSDDDRGVSTRIKSIIFDAILVLMICVIVLFDWSLERKSSLWIVIPILLFVESIIIALLITIIHDNLNSKGARGYIIASYAKRYLTWFGVFLVRPFPIFFLVLGLIVVVLLPYVVFHFLFRLFSLLIPLCDSTMLFLSLVGGSMVTVHHSRPLFGLISFLSPSNDITNSLKRRIMKMIETVYNPSVIKFVIYLCYFIFLLVLTVCELQGIVLFGLSKEMELAIWRSFLVFLAYTNWIEKTKTEEAFSFKKLRDLVRSVRRSKLMDVLS